jgi:hypothetical protein
MHLLRGSRKIQPATIREMATQSRSPTIREMAT